MTDHKWQKDKEIPNIADDKRKMELNNEADPDKAAKDEGVVDEVQYLDHVINWIIRKVFLISVCSVWLMNQCLSNP